MVRNGQVDAATVVLDAPSFMAPTRTVIGHLPGKAGKNDSILLYTHSELSFSTFLPNLGTNYDPF
jgi:hypothetical protein